MENPDAVTALRNPHQWRAFAESTRGIAEYDFSGEDLRDRSSFSKEYAFYSKANFRGCHFSDLTFSETALHKGADFSDCVVHGRTTIQLGAQEQGMLLLFRNARFEGPVQIHGGSFHLEMENCLFDGGLQLVGQFRKVRLHGGDTEIRGGVRTHGCTFYDEFQFRELHVTLGEASDAVSFHDATFLQEADFTSTTFDTAVRFSLSKFRGKALFRATQFKNDAIFDHAEFSARTDFTKSHFAVAPSFYKAQLHAETEFNVVDSFYDQFPDTMSQGAEQRYRVLKTLMDEKKAITENLLFARLEMKAYAHRHPSKANLYRLYETFSDYGLSWKKPAFWLVLLSILAAEIYSIIGGLAGASDWLPFAILGLSNAFPFVAALKALGHDNVVQGFDWRVTLLLAILFIGQNVASTVLLFLIGLGIRNRLRMK